MKKANCKSGCTSTCPCQCVRPKRRKARKNTVPRQNPLIELLAALVTQKIQEPINKPPMFKPFETKSIGTSTEPIQTQTIPTNVKPVVEEIVKQPKERIEAYPSDAERSKYNKEVQEIQERMGIVKPKGERKPRIPRAVVGEGSEVDEEERTRVDTAEAILGGSRGGGGGGFINTTIPEPDKFKVARTKKKNVGVMGNLVDSLQQATNKASTEGEQKIEFE